MIEKAISKIEQFRGNLLAATIASIEARLVHASIGEIQTTNSLYHINQDLLAAASEIKRLSAQIDVIVHTLGIMYSLPFILEDNEVVESSSLGAGNAGSDVDLITNKRIAEFKFIRWQGGSEAVRKKTFFEDYFKLVRYSTNKSKYFYLLNTEIPLRFLRGKSNLTRILDRNKRLQDDFFVRYDQTYKTVGEYYRVNETLVHFVNLTKIVPDIEVLVR